jgi:hypothetical protein
VLGRQRARPARSRHIGSAAVTRAVAAASRSRSIAVRRV